MQGWIEGLQSSIDFIEQHLTDELDIEEIAGKAALSPFYYQRIFGALCGMTVAYLRPEPENPARQCDHLLRCISKYHWRAAV